METIVQDKPALLQQMVSFINDIGIPCVEGELEDGTFLPGVDIQKGTIIYDADKLKNPGDLLHEAGHLAVLLPEHRAVAQSPNDLFGNVDPAAAEMGALAWSWAALTHLGIAPEVVFHEQGYKGGSKELITAYSENKFIGSPLLQWFGMTREWKRDVHADEFTFPKMRHWLRQAQ